MKRMQQQATFGNQQLKEKLFKKTSDLILPQDLELYHRALGYSKLNIPNELSTRNVIIYQDQHIHEIYTKGNDENPHLVMLHGFGGTSLTYVRTFYELSKYYQVHALDTFGVGYSSIGNFKDNFTRDEAIAYFVNAVEQWRKALNIQKFELVGHSFGGYIASRYCKAYPSRVTRLILLSPAGFNNPQQQGDLECRRRMFYWIAEKVYNLNVKPTTMMKNFFFGNKMIDRVLTGRLKLEGEEKQIWKQYFLNIAQRNSSSQTGFYRIFEWPLKTTETIFQMIQEKSISVSVEAYFGGNMDWIHLRQQIHRISPEFPQHVTYQTIEIAGHQIIFDAPDEVVEKILKNRNKKIKLVQDE